SRPAARRRRRTPRSQGSLARPRGGCPLPAPDHRCAAGRSPILLRSGSGTVLIRAGVLVALRGRGVLGAVVLWRPRLHPGPFLRVLAGSGLLRSGLDPGVRVVTGSCGFVLRQLGVLARSTFAGGLHRRQLTDRPVL